MATSFPVNYPNMIIKKSEGLTGTEHKLVTLGYETFLRLWSYPNPYKMQSLGKELCDLLVVFENHIIIFSDKDCTYGNSGDAKVDWRRWYKKAIQKSAEQLIGAKKWIIQFPDRIAIDAKCEKSLPLKIAITPETKFHLIAIAHGASARCQTYFAGGDGGLCINNQIVGSGHIDEKCKPFYVGKVLEDGQHFIHVFDESSYENILKELDTIKDFITFLEIRQELFLKHKILAESDNDILASYLEGLIFRDPYYLSKKCQGYDLIRFDGGLLDDLKKSLRYIDWRKTLEASYFWDSLLQRTFSFVENGMLEYTNVPTIKEQCHLFELMAREDRAHRLCLSDGFMSFYSTMDSDDRGTRIIYSPDEPDICYLLLLVPKMNNKPEKDYRDMRREMLSMYCNIIKAEYPEFNHIIGVAHESNDETYSSEDFVYLDAREWTNEQQEQALTLKKEFEEAGILAKRTITPKNYFVPKIIMRGRDRNKPCPCGSGLKFKNCCGRN